MLLDGLVAAEEAAELIRVSEALGFREIVKNISDNYDQSLPSRTHLRCIIHSTPLADFLWPRIAPHIPREFVSGREGTFRAIRLNPCFRAMRYDADQLFAPHTDTVYRSRDGVSEVSFLTVVLYLNEGYEGGELRFLLNRAGGADNALLTVMPRAGMVAIFQHDLLHEAAPPLGSTPKYIYQTDVIYSKVGR